MQLLVDLVSHSRNSLRGQTMVSTMVVKSGPRQQLLLVKAYQSQSAAVPSYPTYHSLAGPMNVRHELLEPDVGRELALHRLGLDREF